MSKELTRRGLLKTGLFGTAAGIAGAGLTRNAAAAEAPKASTAYDAVVLGAGPAGLITAITAHDLGIRVAVKMLPPNSIPRSEGKAKRVIDRRNNN